MAGDDENELPMTDEEAHAAVAALVKEEIAAGHCETDARQRALARIQVELAQRRGPLN